MRIVISLLLVGCSGGDANGLVPPDDCQPGRLHYTHDLSLPGGVEGGEGDLGIQNFGFINALGGENGTEAAASGK